MIERFSVRWVSFTLLAATILIVLFLSSPKNVEFNLHSLRKLSISVDRDTGENLRTVNGVVPEQDCPVGHYRPPGGTATKRVSGQRFDGCHKCPKGRYGDQRGLVTALCTAPCPVGTYGDKTGLESVLSCEKCPPGTFGIHRGMETKQCSGLCPKGKYSDKYGASSCKTCPPHYHDWQCAKFDGK